MSINVISTIFSVLLLVSLIVYYLKEKKSYKNLDLSHEDDSVRVVSSKITIPLKIQAYERLLLYVERIQFPVLIKRLFNPAISKVDFQFSLLQNVQDEFEHNLAQRLYVSEETWHLINLAREEVLQNVNAVFNDNPEADVAMIAQKLASFENPMVEKAVVSIKREFDAL